MESGARSIADRPSLSRLSASAPARSSTKAASPCPSEIAWCSAVNPSISAVLRGLFPSSSKSFNMGIEPIAAARCNGSCPRLSLTLALHFWDRSLRIVDMLFFEAAKWMAFYFVAQSISSRSTCRWLDFPTKQLYRTTKMETNLARVAPHVHIGFFPQKEVNDGIAFTVFETSGNHDGGPA